MGLNSFIDMTLILLSLIKKRPKITFRNRVILWLVLVRSRMGCNIVLRILLATLFEAPSIYLFEKNNLYLEQFGLLYPPHYCWEERKHSLFLGFIWQDEQNQNKFSRWNLFQKPFPPFPFPSSLSSFNLIEIVNQGTNRGIFIPSLLLKTHAFRCTFTKGASSDVRLRRR